MSIVALLSLNIVDIHFIKLWISLPSSFLLPLLSLSLSLSLFHRFMVYMHTMSADDIGIDGGLVSDRFGCMGQGGPFDVRWHKLTK